MIYNYSALALAIVVTAFSHILLKSGINKSSSYLKSFFHLKTITAYFFLGIASLLVVFAMKKNELGQSISLGQVTVLASINYALILMLSKIFLKETIQKEQTVGVIIIISGIFLYNLENLLS